MLYNWDSLNILICSRKKNEIIQIQLSNKRSFCSWRRWHFSEHFVELSQPAKPRGIFFTRLLWSVIGIYRRQPRALTIKKNKIKCILLESPLGLKGKRVNFSRLLPSWHFYSVPDHSWCPAETAEQIRSKPHLGASAVRGPECAGGRGGCAALPRLLPPSARPLAGKLGSPGGGAGGGRS